MLLSILDFPSRSLFFHGFGFPYVYGRLFRNRNHELIYWNQHEFVRPASDVMWRRQHFERVVVNFHLLITCKTNEVKSSYLYFG